ncbi:hypothetical protein IQ07DRAFT_161172 [Pyrenochaeta sp. DS3sAY3a]|nr:hypothetical protein IQ07DRAFT_161172 [Pyrenochaeta sp. DS3sAY3a]
MYLHGIYFGTCLLTAALPTLISLAEVSKLLNLSMLFYLESNSQIEIVPTVLK